MANNSRNDDFPTIRLEEEDRRNFQTKSNPVNRATVSTSATTEPPVPASGGKGLAVFALLFGLSSCAAAGYLYHLTTKQQALLSGAEQRIQQLENKLSATGEEIGESTVALQIKVTELTNKSTELWEQMDKLWASAWRRNQKEIADLTDRSTADKKQLQESIGQVSRNLDSQKTQLAALSANVAGVSDEMLAINVQMERVATSSTSQQQNVKNLSDKLALLEQRNNALSSRISTLETELRNLATKVVASSGSTPTTPTP
ncbi:hypothetical protein FJ444_04645 [Aestuariibacter sp. GS-14]|uniref:hypothetical protein n=1 Tax=Aestuariibacter sp. GS-14 TaxID=2590670 RepID=UPI00112A670A|nr:hypothetical protein [Aestuariibacter sp. GS-14]TPV60914.1 hypothetical protein FJ444_04645 [Aestuariibacter sp. GS-14]